MLNVDLVDTKGESLSRGGAISGDDKSVEYMLFGEKVLPSNTVLKINLVIGQKPLKVPFKFQNANLPTQKAKVGAKTPDAATVKKQLTPAQLAWGDPVVNSIGMLLVRSKDGGRTWNTPRKLELAGPVICPSCCCWRAAFWCAATEASANA